MTDDEALAFARRRRVDTTRVADLEFWDWAIAKATAGRPVNKPLGARPVRDRADYMRKWRAKQAAEKERLEALAKGKTA